MQISVTSGVVGVDIKDEETGLCSLCVSDNGGCDGSPPYSVEVEMTKDEIDSIISMLVDLKKDLTLNTKNN